MLESALIIDVRVELTLSTLRLCMFSAAACMPSAAATGGVPTAAVSAAAADVRSALCQLASQSIQDGTDIFYNLARLHRMSTVSPQMICI